jgi:formamidopyrimidine-DNA glycosylase
VRSAGTQAEPHDRLLLNLDGDLQLVFNDARKFGRVWLVDEVDQVVGNLGPEPLDEGFTASELFTRLHGTRRQLKPLLLDQTFLAGLGNIYVDEALNLAKLHPLTPANIDWVYRGGDFQNHLRVYQRTGQPCPECGTPIARIIVGQRGTHFCPHCQPLLFPNGG